MEKNTEYFEGDEVYHVFNKSIAGYRIFNNDYEFSRIIEQFTFYQDDIRIGKFYKCRNSNKRIREEKEKKHVLNNGNIKIVDIIAYCVMPTHFHLILKQIKEKGIPIYISNILNSYTRYFNRKHDRKGPLWEGRTKKVLIKTDEQLMHLTRYIHLNPVTANLVKKPDEWMASSYKEYLSGSELKEKICNFKGIVDINKNSYKIFVEDRISYQRELARLKDIILE